MGSVVGGGSAKKAAHRQADAIEKQTRDNVRMANLSVEAMAAQMRNAQEQRLAQEYADDLLSAPAEFAHVSLRPQEQDAGDGSLLTRRRGIRATYQNKPRSGLNMP